MIPDWADSKVYELYDEFITACVLHNDSLLTDERDVFTITALNDVVQRFIVKLLEGNDSFDNKIKKQFDGASYESRLVFAHANWLWCMAPSDFRLDFKKDVASRILGQHLKVPIKENVYPEGGFGSSGPYLKYNKPKEIAFIILVIKQLKLKVATGDIVSLKQAKEMVERMCIKCRYDWDNDDPEFIDPSIWELIPEGKLAMYNILLHLRTPNEYEPIASEAHKNQIYAAFHRLLDEAPIEIKEGNREKQLFYIRKEISKHLDDDEFTFYDPELKKIWNFNHSETDFNEFQALQYKKAIILYGPPGTGKTFSAKTLAQTMIYQQYFSKAENVKEYLNNKPDITSARIHRLQLHANYTFEDFIGGFHLIGGETIPVKGYFLKLIELIKKDDFPHVLILDEINRIDLSRLFGELFSALENRNESIKLSFGDFEITVPPNLFVIGTMNEIDFSLERIDFALRRRFVWFFYGFNSDALRSIISEKEQALGVKLKDDDKEKFISNAQELNKLIANTDELSRQYEIGHTFFAEIVDIYKSYKELEVSPRTIFKSGGPVKVLWDISIRPMLEAFLGNLEKQAQQDKLTDFEKIFLSK